jgi:hypothetical protein
MYREVLDDLCGKFAPGGWVELHGCSVAGDGGVLLHALADLWEVNVLGGVGDQTTAPGWEGAYQVAHPNDPVMDLRLPALVI